MKIVHVLQIVGLLVTEGAASMNFMDDTNRAWTNSEQGNSEQVKYSRQLRQAQLIITLSRIPRVFQIVSTAHYNVALTNPLCMKVNSTACSGHLTSTNVCRQVASATSDLLQTQQL